MTLKELFELPKYKNRKLPKIEMPNEEQVEKFWNSLPESVLFPDASYDVKWLIYIHAQLPEKDQIWLRELTKAASILDNYNRIFQ